MAAASPARAAIAPSRTAAGRRRWNSCRTGSGRTPPPAPGWRSRRPCRAIRRWRGSRRSAARVSRAKPDDALHQPLAAPPVGGDAARRRSSRGAAARTAASGSVAPVRLGLRLGQDAPAGGDHGVGGQHLGSRAQRPRPPSRAPGAGRAGAAVRRAAAFRRCRGRRRGPARCRSAPEAPAAAGWRRPAPASGGGHLKRKVIRPLLRS